MPRYVRKVVFIAAALIVLQAHAGTAVSTMTNTVSILSSCSIIAAGFTTVYDPVVANATADQNAVATVTTTCTVGASPVVTLGQGANAATGSTDSIPARRLSSGGSTPIYLNYNMYSNRDRTVLWGNTAASAPAAATASGAPTVLSVYAKVFAGQTTATAGTYVDSVVATVTF